MRTRPSTAPVSYPVHGRHGCSVARSSSQLAHGLEIGSFGTFQIFLSPSKGGIWYRVGCAALSSAERMSPDPASSSQGKRAGLPAAFGIRQQFPACQEPEVLLVTAC